MNTLELLRTRYTDRLRKIGHVVESVTLVVCIFVCGYVVGQWVATENSRETRLEAQIDHNAEVDRLMRSHAEALRALTGSTVRAAETVESAAVAVESAASAANKAAKQAAQVTKSAGKVPVPNRDAINRSVERANERLKSQ